MSDITDDVTEIDIEDFNQVLEMSVEVSTTEIIVETTSDLPIVIRQAANGVVTIPSLTWLLFTNLPFNPAGLIFRDQNDNIIYPITIDNLSVGMVIVTWLVARRGSWQAS